MATFQRARSDEQREIRRRAILDTASTMLTEMPVAELSLNELSRRVGLAKSNVLRYFESREAVLLDLLDAAVRDWLAQYEADLAAAVTADAPPARRARQIGTATAASLAARPVLCDLVAAQAAVLERNVSAEIAAAYKRGAHASLATLVALVRRHLPELDEADAVQFAALAVLTAGAVWTHAQPSAAMLAAYEAHPELATLRLDFTDTLSSALEVLLLGLLARAAA
ncbi:TetR/AcrR family transcriptional regulator [Yinghuangia soli]|uniref:TetR family transcriptional regulator n=1 Tax=Yinghuangia soli TaxID=2908204 RepID=A0AA41U8T9_9ACTN|nr:TetR family transcriptional regulator [Yinghuangia soli]MCF2533234.1 TetR family transcriptional regulator [Yinghuangia soli]